MKSQPIKRSEDLKLLSREHHIGLLFSWKIKEGLKFNVETSRFNAYLNYFWSNHLKDHFLSEETLLFNKLDDPIVTQALEEHQSIKKLIDEITSVESPDPNEYLLLIDQLNKHIRFEERTVFPLLEQKLPASVLHEIFLALEKDHTSEFKDEFKDEFWIKQK